MLVSQSTNHNSVIGQPNNTTELDLQKSRSFIDSKLLMDASTKRETVTLSNISNSQLAGNSNSKYIEMHKVSGDQKELNQDLLLQSPIQQESIFLPNERRAEEAQTQSVEVCLEKSEFYFALNYQKNIGQQNNKPITLEHIFGLCILVVMANVKKLNKVKDTVEPQHTFRVQCQQLPCLQPKISSLLEHASSNKSLENEADLIYYSSIERIQSLLKKKEVIQLQAPEILSQRQEQPADARKNNSGDIPSKAKIEEAQPDNADFICDFNQLNVKLDDSVSNTMDEAAQCQFLLDFDFSYKGTLEQDKLVTYLHELVNQVLRDYVIERVLSMISAEEKDIQRDLYLKVCSLDPVFVQQVYQSFTIQRVQYQFCVDLQQQVLYFEQIMNDIHEAIMKKYKQLIREQFDLRTQVDQFNVIPHLLFLEEFPEHEKESEIQAFESIADLKSRYLPKYRQQLARCQRQLPKLTYIFSSHYLPQNQKSKIDVKSFNGLKNFNSIPCSARDGARADLTVKRSYFVKFQMDSKGISLNTYNLAGELVLALQKILYQYYQWVLARNALLKQIVI